jgi:hypothetical protein
MMHAGLLILGCEANLSPGCSGGPMSSELEAWSSSLAAQEVLEVGGPLS